MGQQELTGGKHTVNEGLLSDTAILVLVDAPEDVQDAGFQVADPLSVPLPPDLEVKAGEGFHLSRNTTDGEETESTIKERQMKNLLNSLLLIKK